MLFINLLNIFSENNLNFQQTNKKQEAKHEAQSPTGVGPKPCPHLAYVFIKSPLLLFTYLMGSVGSALLARFSADSCSHLKCKLQSKPAAGDRRKRERDREREINEDLFALISCLIL